MRTSDYTDDQWAEAHSGLAPSVLAQFAATHADDYQVDEEEED